MEDKRIIEILLRMEENQQKFFSETLAILRDGQLKPIKSDDIPEVQELVPEIVLDVKKVLCLLENPPPADRTDPNNWWTPEKTLSYLGCSIRTLYTLRITDEVEWTRKRGKYRYFAPGLVEIRTRLLK